MTVLIIWLFLGLIGTLGFYVTLAHYDRMGWCPSPAGIIGMIFGVVIGPVTLLMFVILLASLVLDYVTSNDKFMEWLVTPVCKKKKK